MSESPNISGEAVQGDTKGAFDTSGVVCQTHVGGQALIEGIMMRGRYNWAVAVREPAGTIYTEQHDLASGRDKNRWMYWPVVRGVTAFVESLGLGYKALQISAEHAYDIEDDGSDGSSHTARSSAGKPGIGAALMGFSATAMLQAALAVEPVTPQDHGDAGDTGSIRSGSDADDDAASQDGGGMPAGLMTLSMVLGIVLGIVLFIVAPAVLTNLVVGDYTKGTLVWNLTDGFVRVAVFIAYLALISLMPDIKRMFAYHGAEHKTIHCYEHGLPLTPANAQRFPRLHVRCGTAFLLMTMIIAIIVFTVVPVDKVIAATGVTNGAARLAMVIASRIILLPVVAGLAYEVTVKWAGSRPENPVVKVVLWPGLQLQRLTTNIPDDGMLECAIDAMGIVLSREDAQARSVTASA